MTREEQVQKAVEALKALREKMTGGGYLDASSVAERIMFDGNTLVSFDIRHWGVWENPSYAEDEEDYDWQILTEESRSRLQELTEDYSKRYGVTIRFTVEEKNWLSLTVQINSKE